jgi:amino acid transporter
MAIGIKNSTDSDIYKQTEKLREKTNYEFPYQEGVAKIVATVIQAFLGLLGIIFLVLIIIAGYNWMTAAGNEEKVTKAKDTLWRAIIGLIIIVGAYAISYFVFNNLPYGNGAGPGQVSGQG